MARLTKKLLAFNRGIVSRLGLSREDIDRVSLSAEIQKNWMPRVLGSMMLRPGLGYIGESRNNAKAKYLSFIYAADDTALLELTDSTLRVWVNDSLLSYPAISTAIVNGTFAQTATTATISNGTPAVITYVGTDDFIEDDAIALTTTGALPSPFVVNRNYYIINLNVGAKTFNLSSTSGGAAINSTTAGSGVHTISKIQGWDSGDESGAASLYSSSGLALTGALTSAAIRRQTLTIGAPDQNVRHAIKISVSRGACTFRVGSTLNGDEYITKTTLGRGNHSLAFVPTGASVYVQVESYAQATVLIESIVMASSGAIEVITPWAESDLEFIANPAASADVLFVACKNKQQMKIERRGSHSWSVVYYEPADGPFLNENITPTKLAPSALTGSGVNITATGTTSLFKSTDVGRLIEIHSVGQKISKQFAALDEVTETLRVTAVGSNRTFSINITGTWTGTIALQRSVGDDISWADVETYTTNQNKTYNDALDNQIVYFRLKMTAFTSVTSNISELNYGLGSSIGVGKITSVTHSLVAVVDVLNSFGGTTATDTWALGIWSDTTGWPTAVGFRDGRLWWGGKTWIIGSVSDGYSSFDSYIEGNSAPIIRTIGFGPVDVINWLAETNRLIIGTSGAEIAIASSALEEAVTNSTFNLKRISTQGSSLTSTVSIDTSIIFARRGGARLFEIDVDNQTNSLTTMTPDLFESPIVKLAVQRMPDTRLHALRADGSVAVLVFDKVEKVFCWIVVETDGVVEDIAVLPGSSEDNVYYLVNRTISGSTKRYLEKWALETEAHGGVTNKIADSFITYSGSATATITGLGHLEGKVVIVWGNSKALGEYTVSGSAITLTEAVTLAFIGLPYDAIYQSAKLAPLTSSSRIDHVGLSLLDTHARGLEYGQDFIIMDGLPQTEGYGLVSEDAVWDKYDESAIEMPGVWSTDSRLCLRATAPYPCTVAACIIGMVANDK